MLCRKPAAGDHVAAIMGIRNLLRTRAVQSTVEGVVLDPDRLLWVSIEKGRELEVHARIHDRTALDLAPGSPVRLSLRREALVILQPSAEPGRADAGPPAEG